MCVCFFHYLHCSYIIFLVGLSIYTSYFHFLSFTLVQTFHILCVFIPSLIGKLHLKLIREEVLFEIDHIGHYPSFFFFKKFFMIYNNFAKKTIKPSIIGYFLPNSSLNRIITTIFLKQTFGILCFGSWRVTIRINC